jgi:hypothetical protein
MEQGIRTEKQSGAPLRELVFGLTAAETPI